MPAVVRHAAADKHSATLIFLHGLGDTGHGWLQNLGQIVGEHVKIICPHAPTKHVTMNPMFPMPSWFDIKSLDFNGIRDEAGIAESIQYVRKYIDGELNRGIAADRIIVGGFSQGAALSCHIFEKSTEAFAGLVMLSGFLVLHDKRAQLSIPDKRRPILVCHGDSDPVVAYEYGRKSVEFLKKDHTSVEFKTYPGLAHSSSDREMNDVSSFIKKLLPEVTVTEEIVRNEVL